MSADREAERSLLIVDVDDGAVRETGRTVVITEQQTGFIRETGRAIIYLSDVPPADAYITTLD